MSEYQYYEFQAVDRPLTEKEQAYISSLSSRVELTPRQAIFTYSYADFRGDKMKVLAKYFDAMLYMSSWGSRQLAFRLPLALVDPAMIEPYCLEEMISVDKAGNHLILNIIFDDEEGGGWIEGEGWLDSLIALRQDILRGDLRALYLAWLKGISIERGVIDPEDLDDPEDSMYAEDFIVSLDLIEPPVPPGLRSLSPPLKSLIEFFEIDQGLIAVASKTSPQSDDVAAEDLEGLIGSLSERERNEFLRKLLRGEPNLDIQLAKRLREAAGERKGAKALETPERRSVGDLLAAAAAETKRRKEKKHRKAEQERIRRLEELSQKQSEVWREIHALIEKKQSKTLDEAVKLIIEMRDVANFLGESDKFKKRMEEMGQQYRGRPGLMYRLRDAGLL